MSNKGIFLGEIFDIERGGSPRPIQHYLSEDADSVPWVMIGDTTVGGKYIERTRLRIKKEGIRKSREVYPGELLLTNSMSFGRPYILKTYGCIHDGWLALKPKHSDIDLDYAYHALGSAHTMGQFQKQAAGATVKNLNKDIVASVKIPLPPLEEQRRIAAILDKADSLEAFSGLREKSLSSFEDSLFFHFVGGITEQEHRWGWHSFGDLCTRLTVGVVVKPASYYCEIGIPALRSLNVKTGVISKENLVFISEQDNNGTLAKSKLAKDDLVFVRSGRPGTCAVIPSELDGCNAIDLLLATVDQSRILPEFAASYFNSHGGRASILSESRGQVQQHFNAGSLAAAEIPVPPLAVQQEFCTVLNQRRKQSRRCEHSLVTLGRLSRSLSSDLFGGV